MDKLQRAKDFHQRALQIKIKASGPTHAELVLRTTILVKYIKMWVNWKWPKTIDDELWKRDKITLTNSC